MKVAAVTGASSGIGKAVCISLIGAGYTVVGGARRMEKMQEIHDALDDESKKRFRYFPLDVTSEESISAFFAKMKAEVGPINLLVNSAGLGFASDAGASLIDGDPAVWRRVWETNVTGVCLCSQHALKEIISQSESHAGHIVIISSMSGHRVVKGNGVYASSKFAVRAVAEGIRQELRMRKLHRVRVGLISPGIVETEFHNTYLSSVEAGQKFYSSLDDLEKIKAEDIASIVLNMVTLPMSCEINDVLIRPAGQLS